MIVCLSMEHINNNNESEYTRSEARMHIEGVRGEIAAMGANDSEFESLNQIIERLEDSLITPVEAIAQANGVRDSKQAYH